MLPVLRNEVKTMICALDEKFGQRLRKVRKRKRMFRFQVAQRAGCETKLVKRLEKGYARSISSVQLTGICSALDVPMETLLEERESAHCR